MLSNFIWYKGLLVIGSFHYGNKTSGSHTWHWSNMASSEIPNSTQSQCSVSENPVLMIHVVRDTNMSPVTFRILTPRPQLKIPTQMMRSLGCDSLDRNKEPACYSGTGICFTSTSRFTSIQRSGKKQDQIRSSTKEIPARETEVWYKIYCGSSKMMDLIVFIFLVSECL